MRVLARRSATFSIALAPLLAMQLGACGGSGFPDVVEAASIGAGGSPRVSRVRDIGSAPTGQPGAKLLGESDGVAVIGELVLVEGGGFGKSPSVTVGGVVAEVAARTAGGGIVARVAPGTATGIVPVTVTVGGGRGTATTVVRRLGVVLHGGSLRAFSVDDGWRGPALPLPGVTALAMSAEGACGFALAGELLQVIDLAAPGGPRQAATRGLAVAARQIVVAEQSRVIFVVGDEAIQGFEVGEPRAPARYDAVALPPSVRGATRAALDGSGHRLALLLPEGNRVALLDVSRRTEVTLLGEVALLPGERAPLLVDLGFSPDGQTLYVLAGDNPASRASGHQAARLLGVRVEGAEARPVLWRSATVATPGAPLRLLLSHRREMASATTIRLGPEKATVRLLSVGAHGGGAVVAADLTGEATTLVESDRAMRAADVAPDGSLRLLAGAPASSATSGGTDAVDGALSVAALAANPRATLNFSPLDGDATIAPGDQLLVQP